jgi:hypothetical protein
MWLSSGFKPRLLKGTEMHICLQGKDVNVQRSAAQTATIQIKLVARKVIWPWSSYVVAECDC